MAYCGDYVLLMQDKTGRVCFVPINGACVREALERGGTREDVETNAFANAIARGEIGEDAWLIERRG
jgi:hypothetical protein